MPTGLRIFIMSITTLKLKYFPLGLRGIEGVTLISVFHFNKVTPPYPLLSQEGELGTILF